MSSTFNWNNYINHYIDSDSDEDRGHYIIPEPVVPDPTFVSTCNTLASLSHGVLSLLSPQEYTDEPYIISSSSKELFVASGSFNKQVEIVAIQAEADIEFAGLHVPIGMYVYSHDKKSNIFYSIAIAGVFALDDVIFHYHIIPWKCGLQSTEELCFTGDIIRIAPPLLRQMYSYDPNIINFSDYDVVSSESVYARKEYTNTIRRFYPRGLNWEVLGLGNTPDASLESRTLAGFPLPEDKPKSTTSIFFLTLSPDTDVFLNLKIYTLSCKKMFKLNMKSGASYVINYELTDFNYMEFETPRDIYMDIKWDLQGTECPGKSLVTPFCNFDINHRFAKHSVPQYYVAFPDSFPYIGTSLFEHAGITSVVTYPTFRIGRHIDNTSPILLKYSSDIDFRCYILCLDLTSSSSWS